MVEQGGVVRFAAEGSTNEKMIVYLGEIAHASKPEGPAIFAAVKLLVGNTNRISANTFLDPMCKKARAILQFRIEIVSESCT